MLKLIGRLFSFLFIVIILFGGTFAVLYARFNVPGPLSYTVDVIIPKGSTVNQIAKQLSDLGIIEDEFIFKFGVFTTQNTAKLRAGEYRFRAKLSPKEVMETIISGKTVQRRITIAEGLMNSEIKEILYSTEGLFGDVDSFPNEGNLLPETYYYSYGDQRSQVLNRMKKSMAKAIDLYWEKRPPNYPLKTKEEALILASIVEKETGIADERPRIAAVFLNRIEKRMKLQSDPTVIYGLTKGQKKLDRPLTKKDLGTYTAFNTYVIPYLPPTPIANPGLDSIKATLNPIESDEFYFVADGTGGHIFANSLKEHNRNVQRWRQIQKERKQQEIENEKIEAPE